MRKSARKKFAGEDERKTLLFGLGDFIHRELRGFVVSAGMTALGTLLENERAKLCGPRYVHQLERRRGRAGHAPGELIMGWRRVTVERPRVRSVDGREVPLPSWTMFAAEDPLRERALEQMLIGVSTRRYRRSLEDLPSDVVARGTSKSAVSRRFVAATEAQMGEWLGRGLADIDLAVLMIDGVFIGSHVILVALGIDADGKKHVLGIREGATESTVACTALLADLRERGVRTDRTILAVLDGSKALSKAVKSIFGERVLIQRCQAHKTRNVLDQLPEDLRPSVRMALLQAYRCGNPATAKKLLMNLAHRLRNEHPGAAASLEEGLDETLTVMAFALPRSLERVLSTTNAIENLIGSVRSLGRRVKRWRGGQMMLRWTAAAVVDASTRFRRIVGARAAMSTLVRNLRAHDQTRSDVAPKKRMA